MRCDLVLEGGGVKGIALVGAVDVLEERGYEVQRVAGTSAGAIVGALVAAGLPSERRRTLMEHVDYTAFQDTSALDRFPGGKLLSLLSEHGVYEGAYLTRWLTEQLASCGVHTFADLRCDDEGAAPTSGFRSRLVVMASDVTAGRLRRLPDDYPAIGVARLTSVPVADAVRASMSIPFFFEPVRLRGPNGTPVVLVDGGMLSNFPIAVFDRSDGRAPRWPTFGIKLSARAGTQAARFPCDSVTDMARAMLGTMTSFYDQMHLDGAAVLDRTIFVDTFGVKATDFDLDAATRDRLYASGRSAAEKFLSSWDFESYIRKHRTAVVPAQADAQLRDPVPVAR
jgi:NTE family protein